MFYKMDEELILTCQSKLEGDSKSSMAAEKRRLTWEQLETAASFQPVGGGGCNISFLVNPATCSVTC